MPSILPMAAITLVASALLWGATLWAYTGRTWRFVKFVWLGLPLSAIVNLLVKGPLGKGVGGLAGIEPGLGLSTPAWFLLFLFGLSPIFEELVKAAPALLPSVRRRIAGPDDAYWMGMALGIGFGLGEIIYLAWGIASSGAYGQYPWYAFTGFLGERLLVVFLHGFMTSLFLWLAFRRKAGFGYLAAAGTHAVLNAPAMLYQLGLAPAWIASLWLVAVLIGCLIVFERIRPKTTRERLDGPDVVYYSAGGR
jgi:hypothetical protein